MEGFDTSGLIQEFVEDSRVLLEKLDDAVLEMEKELGHEVDVELVTDLLGSLHTLKGNCGMMGLSGLQQYVHCLEDVFRAMLDGAYKLDEARCQKLFDAAADLGGALESISADPKSSPDMPGKISGLKDAFLSGDKPSADALASASRSDSLRYIGAKSNILKVDFNKLDNLLNLTGELVIHRTKLARLESRFSEMGLDRTLTADLSEAAGLINKGISELQEAVMDVRMLPIRQVFQRFPRMVRDLSKERDKEIRIEFSGENTELDKTVIDEIGEPLMHLIRNAVDHGIEAPRQRSKKNKPPSGKIVISAAQEGNHIVITVSDDGKGIDLEKVKAKAARLRSPEELEAMGDKSLLNLIFESGLSTADSVTELSGRGVGLDVVKKKVASLGGMLEVDSEPDKGSVFTIRLPLTLAIISSLMVESGAEIYALPLSSIIESIRLESGMTHLVNGKEVITLRGRVLTLLRLRDFLGISTKTKAGDGNGYVVVLGHAEKRVGLVVDRLAGRQEIVIKGLDDYVGKNACIAGATILGDGRVVLIIDTAGLMGRNLERAKMAETSAGEA